MSIYKNFIADGLQGGTSRDLDSFPIANLTSGDRAFVSDSGNFYYFKFDSTSTAAETVASHPYYIRPDDYATSGVWVEQQTSGSGGSGTVTSVSVVSANGISGSVANPTTTPAITLTLGAITPSTVNGLTLAAQATGFTIAGGTTSKTLTVAADASVSGTNTGDNAYWTIVGGVMSPTTAGNTVSIPLTALATTPTAGILLTNTTPATDAVKVQMTPVFMLGSQVWNTSASEASNWFIMGLPTSAATPTSFLKIGYQRAAGSLTYPMELSNVGRLTLAADIIIGPGRYITSDAGYTYGMLKFGTASSGSYTERNRADAYSVLQINNLHASSTGNILDLQWQTVNRLCVTKEGNISAPHADGVKIGITAAEKIAFWGLAPMAQPAAIANATGSGGGDAHTQLNLLLAQLRLMGLIAAA